jgi:hypothetical protein
LFASRLLNSANRALRRRFSAADIGHAPHRGALAGKQWIEEHPTHATDRNSDHKEKTVGLHDA